MTNGYDPKRELHGYFKAARKALLWKLDGLSEYDVRRPMVRTGTNLLGIVKHVGLVTIGYFGDTFGRPFDDPVEWIDHDSEPNADLFARASESREQIVDLYHRAGEHAAATVEALPLDAVGRVPWWPADRAEVTLHHILVRTTAETNRHAGHADIVRELIDGKRGNHPGQEMLPSEDDAWWQAYRDRVEQAAREAAGRAD